MKDIAWLVPAFNCPELLRICLPSLRKSMGENDDIFVILNNGKEDLDSIKACKDNNAVCIITEANLGPGAVDLAMPLIKDKYKYIGNVNTDMCFQEGMTPLLIGLLEKNYPCTVSITLCEPVECAHSIYEYFGPFASTDNLHEKFNDNIKNGKYRAKQAVSYNHPIVCRAEDFFAVNGYSDNMDPSWVAVLGKGLDDNFVWRLKNFNNSYQFIKCHKVFCYHGVNINGKHIQRKLNGHATFRHKTGMLIEQFRKSINYY